MELDTVLLLIASHRSGPFDANGASGRIKLDRVQWGKKVKDELNKLAPDKQATRGWLESQDFKVINSQEKPEGSWWFHAENPRMSFRKIWVQWDVHQTPTLKVTVSSKGRAK